MTRPSRMASGLGINSQPSLGAIKDGSIAFGRKEVRREIASGEFEGLEESDRL